MALLVAVSDAGHTPPSNWLANAESALSPHMHLAGPHECAGLMWAYGCFNHTPRPPFLQDLYLHTQTLLQQHLVGPLALLQMLYGASRFAATVSTAASPSQAWLLVWMSELQPHLPGLPPPVLCDVLFSLTCLQAKPPQLWMRKAVAQIHKGLDPNLDADMDPGSRDLEESPPPPSPLADEVDQARLGLSLRPQPQHHTEFGQSGGCVGCLCVCV